MCRSPLKLNAAPVLTAGDLLKFNSCERPRDAPRLGNIMKTNLTRRAVINRGTTLAIATTLAEPTLLNWARAWAQTVPWKPENGAQLSLLRWKYFFRGEDDGCVAVMDAFTKATGVKVNITRESDDDVQPKASVAAEGSHSAMLREMVLAGCTGVCGRTAAIPSIRTTR
jgi:hypothetical protein